MQKQIELIKQTRSRFIQLVESLSITQLNEIPAGMSNNIAWNFGHIVAAQQGLCNGLSGVALNLDPGFITNLTGIDNEMVRTAPKFYELARRIVEITEDMVFVAHNVSFDYRFIQEEFKRLGYDYQRETMCTVRMGRKFLPGHKSYSLGRICDELGITIEGRHRAAGDALATVKLFEVILAKKALKERKQPPGQLKLNL